jgi:hypothetical protein
VLFLDRVFDILRRRCPWRSRLYRDFTSMTTASGYPPLRRNPAVLNRFSPSPSGSTHMSQELVKVNVSDLCREDGRRGADEETGVPKVEF